MIGTRLGPYEITAKLGAGGMGEVWQAKDFHLGRNVALKVLPAGFTQDPERLARFEREAKLLAQLNHPNIAQIYGFEASGETRALVMELVEGPTLAERLEFGDSHQIPPSASGASALSRNLDDCHRIPLGETLSIALQIAHALEEAHEKGIVHRDLKPQNIKASMEGRVKVLDFGLAKALDPAAGATASASQLAQSPTLTLGATQMGIILGTAAYMAPEQAKGLTVDKRADIWAFGVVLFEMLTGERLFGGETVPETLAGVIRAEIDLSKLPAETPSAIRRLLERCLERDPKRRLRDIGEARVLLERPLEMVAGAGVPPAAARPLWLPLALVGLAAAALGGWIAWKVRSPATSAPDSPVTRLHLLAPAGGQFGAYDGPVMLSPDGTRIVFRFEKPGQEAELVVRSLDRFDSVSLRGTGGTYEPGWSPDGRSILFFSDWLSRVDAAGLQPPQKLTQVIDGRGASWGEDGTILFAPSPTGVIERVSANGGTPSKVTALDVGRGEVAHMRPQWLPDREHFLYLVKSEAEENTGIFVGSLDGKLKKRLLPLDVGVRFTPPDLVLAVQDHRLIARRLDLAKLEISGEAWTIAEDVEYVAQYELPPFSTSRNGRLVYHVPGKAQVRQLARFDRSGKLLETIGEPGDTNLDLAPDGSRLATMRLDDQNRLAIWIHDLERGVVSRFSPEPRSNGPVWSPDGRSVAYAVFAATGVRLVIRPAAGGAERTVWTDVHLVEPIDWSPDGRTILAETGAPGERSNLVLVPADGSGAVTPFAATTASEQSGRFSPDGRWIAYVSDESGREQIFVEPIPKTGARFLVSPRGGDAPRWTGNDELLYVERGERDDLSTLYSVAVERRGAELQLGAAKSLGTLPSIDYEPRAGGRELYATKPVSKGEALPPVFIENWLALVPRR